MSRDRVRSLLEQGSNEIELRLHASVIGEWTDEFLTSPGLHPSTLPEDDAEILESLVFFLKGRLQKDGLEIAQLRRSHVEFVKRLARASSASARESIVLDFARTLGASPADLRRDRKAFSRWFDADCVQERYDKRLHQLESHLARALERLGVLTAALLLNLTSASRKKRRWEKLLLGEVLEPLFTYEGDVRVVRASLRCLRRVLAAWPEVTDSSVDQGMLQFIYQSALHTKQDTWVQCEALAILPSLSPESLPQVLERRLAQPGDGDDIFVRRRAVALLVAHLRRDRRLARWIPVVVEDPSPYVRQGLAEALASAPHELAFPAVERLTLRDASAPVRASAVRTAAQLARRPELETEALALLDTALSTEEDPFVCQVALESTVKLAPHVGDRSARHLRALAESLRRRSADVRVRRCAGLAAERLWVHTDLRTQELRKQLEAAARGVPAGGTVRMPLPFLAEEEAHDLVPRVLSTLGQEDFGFDADIRRGWLRLTKGHVFRFRWWRFLHEFRHPAPDKRQAFPHTVGRSFSGTSRAPSSILGELAETKVPGEPLYLEEEGGWRPYLPLPDEFLSSVSGVLTPKPFRIFTSEGVTEVTPPATCLGRLRAAAALTWRFPAYARLRNWRESSSTNPRQYLESQVRLGFEVRLRPHDPASSLDPSVARFFPAAFPIFDSDVFYQVQEYFISLYENSLSDLLLFSGGSLAAFLGHHWNANRVLREAREKIPLVIGGWGTRGKSGSERLKAALMNALGYGVVSKTTGCEAMFLYCHPFGPLHEMFLFRSYDKATIWEQANVVKLAAALGADVFLWECMGLKPEYVDILQRQWMQDDLSTLTNAYPDHEDIQGPAGFNIPEAMTSFIPERSRLITSEELMLPILSENAREKRTSVRTVDGIEAGLLTPDVLERFPYEEHPNNVALVLALAEELGVERDFALKEMADHVVPDLGVLKTYPTATLRTRRLEFTNGNSANDRHGALGNYRRLNFDTQCRDRDPGVWKTTVVNNRADRVPRSRVFAGILVNDITADRHYLIGGNLKGLVGYIREAWDEGSVARTLWPESGARDPADVLEDEARRRRIPRNRAQVKKRFAAMLSPDLEPRVRAHLVQLVDAPSKVRNAEALGHLAGDIALQLERDLAALAEYENLAAKIRAGSTVDREALDREFRQTLWAWFERTLVVVDDYDISGDGLVDLIARDTPPGYRNRILGLQNIKGTGLDFVYRWQAWELCHRAGRQLLARDASVAQQGLRTLSTFREYGFLGEEFLHDVLERAGQSAAAQNEGFQAELSVIRSQLAESLARVRETAGAKGGRTWVTAILNAAEAFLDPGDSVKRRRTADRIYRDLFAARVSSERAVTELKSLIQRQKGGWLGRAFESLRRRVTPDAEPDEGSRADPDSLPSR